MASGIYRDLNANISEMRLLRILPGLRDTPLVGRLIHTSIDASNGTYVALSYTWGSENMTKVLRLKMTKSHTYYALRIAQNLYDMLNHHRHELREVTVWVDAVCINQDNIQERTQQVCLMREIYGRAAKVLVWLGVAHDGSDRAMADIQTIASRGLEFIDPSRYNMSQIGSLLSRPWFDRVWVRQEVYVARSDMSQVRCGEAVVTFQDFSIFLAILIRAMSDIRMGGTTHWVKKLGPWLREKGAAHLAGLSMCMSSKKECVPLGEWLPVSTHLRATDKRDHVFAMLALSSEFEEVKYLIDYSKSQQHVFSSIALDRMRKSQNLDILSYAGGPGGPEIPSWTADWSSRSINEGLVLSPLYKADQHLPFQFKVDDGLKTLTLRGVYVDEIKSVGQRISGTSGDYYYVRQFCTWEDMAAADPQCIRHYKSRGTSVSEAFWRTMISDAYINLFSHVKKRWPKGDIAAELRAFAHRIPYLYDGNCEWIPAEFDLTYIPSTLQIFELMKLTFVISAEGHMGLAPRWVKMGDIICILGGARMPCILRRNNNMTYQFLGFGYIHGIMDGEAVVDETGNHEIPWQEFQLT